MMNNNRGLGSNPGGGGGGVGADQSALSLLVSAADTRDSARGQAQQHQQHQQQQQQQHQQNNAAAAAAAMQNRNLAEALRMRGLSAGPDPGGFTLEEQLFLQQQAQGPYGHPQGLLSQFRDAGLVSQLGQQQHLAALLSLAGPVQGSDMRAAIAAAQMRQAQQQHAQFTHADLLALNRSGGLAGMFGPPGSGPLQGLGAADFEGLQRLEELDRRQRLMAANAGPAMASSNSTLSRAAAAAAGGGGEPPEPTMSRQDSSTGASTNVASSNHAPTGGGGRRSNKRSDTPSTAQSPRATKIVPPLPSKASAAMAAATSAKEAAAAAAKEAASSPAAAAATAASDPNKDELEKAPGSVIVPCRARGMPMDHNFKTAYFVIPENVKHGEELICSYFACRNAGIKFRYCSHCKVPVAKRNFRKRHKHGGEDVDKLAEDDSCGDDDMMPVGKGIPSQITASREEAVEADGISSQSADSTNHQDKNIQNEADMQKGLVRISMRTFETAKHAKGAAAAAISGGGGGGGTGGGGKIGEDRRQRWATLLARRPSTKDGDSMSAWLMEVLAVSDLETPLKPAGTSGGEPSPPPVLAPAQGYATKKPANPQPQHSDGSTNDDSQNNGNKKSNMTAAAAITYATNNNNNNGKNTTKKKGGGKLNAVHATALLSNNISPALKGVSGTTSATAGGNTKAPQQQHQQGSSSMAPSSSNNINTSNGLIKKKRQSDLASSESYVSGSFAEWKERKKQKKQVKLGPTSGGGGGNTPMSAPTKDKEQV